MRLMVAVHVPPVLTVTVAIVVAVGLIIYWLRLGRGEVPSSRRRVRRISVAIMVLALPNFVRGLSFLEPTVDRTEYVVSWTVTLVAILLIIMTAVFDVIVSVHLQRGAYDDELREAGSALAEALRNHDEAAAHDPPEPPA